MILALCSHDHWLFVQVCIDSLVFNDVCVDICIGVIDYSSSFASSVYPRLIVVSLLVALICLLALNDASWVFALVFHCCCDCCACLMFALMFHWSSIDLVSNGVLLIPTKIVSLICHGLLVDDCITGPLPYL